MVIAESDREYALLITIVEEEVQWNRTCWEDRL